jgi:hypothetical protein
MKELIDRIRWWLRGKPSSEHGARQYRLLKAGEHVQVGDEFACGEHWIATTLPDLPIHTRDCGHYRRPTNGNHNK